MKKILRAAAALALAGCMMTANVFAATTFTDVPSDYWGKTFIDQAADAGLVSGMGDGTYGINGKLSSAQFTTMVCNLICKDDVTTYQNTYKPAEWWRAYMAVAYSKGFLKNTTVGDARAASNAWSASSVNAEISRYDMAQIMVNVANSKGWSMPTTAQVLAAQAKIADWSKIPAKYQTAVATAYAKEYLSGMDSIGTFAGDQTMTRTHGAVVICKLLNENKSSSAVTTPTFTNTTKLVNGKEATEGNVVDAVKALKAEYPNNYLWNMSNTYRSVVLGNSVGADAFTLMLADRVFGNFALGVSDADELKPGDVVFLNNLRIHVLVEDIDGEEFSYVCCNSTGKVTWGNTHKIADLTNWDTIYTRYEGEGDYSSSDSEEGTLSNGEKVTASNIKELIDQFLDEEYDIDSEWTKSGKYPNFKSGRAYDDEAFAYHLSDYIFGDLEVYDLKDFDDLRVGDIIYWAKDKEFVTVTKIANGKVSYVGVYAETVYDSTLLVSELGKDDYAYTRYPDAAEDDEDETLSNGKAVTISNVKSLIEVFKDEEYDAGDSWDKSGKYLNFKSTKVYSDESFAYYFSDYIFGDLEVEEVDDFDDLREGDVIYWDDENEYVVVTLVDDDIIEYLGVKSKKVYEGALYISDLGTSDEAYTRYNGVTSDDKDDTLSNGKAVTSTNVTALINKFLTGDNAVGKEWKDSASYKSANFKSNKKVTGNEAFAYKLSDYVFSKLAVSEVKDFDKLHVGDIIFYDAWEEYLTVTKISGDTIYFVGVYGEEIYEDTLDVEDLGDTDKAYTRYPTSSSTSTTNKLSNGKSATASNVKALIVKFMEEKYDDGDPFSETGKFTNFKSTKVKEDEAFAYYLSDYIFGDLKVKKITDFSKLRVGDVVYWADYKEYVVVTGIGDDTIYYVGVEVGVSEDTVYTFELTLDELTGNSFAYTRYPS